MRLQSRYIAKISAEMVKEALKTAPQSFICGARVPDKDFALPSTFSGYVLDNGGIFTRDFKTGERRIANAQDNYEFLRVFDEMKLATMVWGTSVQEPEPYNLIRKILLIYYIRVQWCLVLVNLANHTVEYIMN